MKTSMTAAEIVRLKRLKLARLIYCSKCKDKTYHVRNTIKSFWRCPECNTVIIGSFNISALVGGARGG